MKHPVQVIRQFTSPSSQFQFNSYQPGIPIKLQIPPKAERKNEKIKFRGRDPNLNLYDPVQSASKRLRTD